MLQNIALILMGLGTLALIGWSVQAFFMSAEVPLLVRIAVGAVAAGILILAGLAIRDRREKAKDEDFKGVER